MSARRRRSARRGPRYSAACAVPIAALVLLASGRAQGQTAPRVPAARSHAEVRPRVRLRGGIGFHGGTGVLTDGFAPYNFGVFASGTGPGLFLRGGVQFGDAFGLDLEAAGGTLLASGYGRIALYADLAPTPWLSIAAGPVATGLYAAFTDGGGYAGGSLRIETHLRRSVDAFGRGALSIGVEGDVGAGIARFESLGLGAYLLVGYTRD